MSRRRKAKPISLAGRAGPLDRRVAEMQRRGEVAPVTVEDPYGLTPGEKVVALRTLRDDPLAALHHNRMIDEAQYKAGRHWQLAYEAADIGTIRSIDLSRERVDGGSAPELTVNERTSRGLAELAKATTALGLEGEAIVRHVLGERMTFAVAAAKRGLATEAERKYIGRRFRECLETLALVYGYAMPRR
jgi:hypothetical protein